MRLPELLAPAGSMDHLKIAIFSGASSIYLSGKKFGARKHAGNLTLSEIKEAVNFAHIYNVKVFVTPNTLIRNQELSEIATYLVDLYKIGVDAVLIQDIGIVKLINDICPGLTIHASTQMNIQNIEGLKWAKSNGISRVVLPRELNIFEVKEMTEFAHSIDMEIEIFVHGALCYSYSGRCLFSSLIGGRSGNRGTCAQPCRQKYRLAIDDNNGKKIHISNRKNEDFLLSTRDLSLHDELETLARLNIDSLKIEGRMRNSEYVSTVVSSYRKSLNRLKSNSNNKGSNSFITKNNSKILNNSNKKKKKISNIEDENLKLVFNRGVTQGQLLSPNSEKIMARKKPGHVGLYIGKVKEFSPKTNEIAIELTNNLKNIPQRGDGLLFESDSDSYGLEISNNPILLNKEDHYEFNEKRVLTIKKVRENKTIKINKDFNVYLTKRKKIIDSTKSIIHDKNIQSFRKSVLSLKFTIGSKHNNDNNTTSYLPVLEGSLKLANGKLINIIGEGKESWEIAKNKPTSSKQLKKQLLKIGDLPFFIDDVKIHYSGNLFAPISQINDFRRQFFSKLNNAIKDSYKPSKEDLFHTKKNLKRFQNKIIEKGPNNTQNMGASNNCSNINTPSNINSSSNNNNNNNNNNGSSVNNCNDKDEEYSLSIYLNDLDNLRDVSESDISKISRVYIEIPPKENLLTNNHNDSNRNKNKNNDIDISYYINFLKEAINISKNQNYELIWKWPDIIHNYLKDMLIKIIGISKKLDIKINIMTSSLGLNSYLKDNYEVKVYGSHPLNIVNIESVLNLKARNDLNSNNFDLLTLSPELNFDDLKILMDSINKCPKENLSTIELIVQGNIESLVSKNSLIPSKQIKNIKKIANENKIDVNKNNVNIYLNDFKNNYYPIKPIQISKDTRPGTILFNYKDISFINDITFLKSLFISNFSLDMRWKSSDDIIDSINNYTKIIFEN